MADPLFSVVVPTYRRPRRLAACLDALDHLVYPEAGFETIVVLDEEGDAAPPPRPRVRFLRQAHAGPGVARNTGAAQARGRFLAFTDDDCLPAPGWLSRLEAGFEETGADVLGGCTVNALPESLCSEASHLLLLYVYRYFNTDPLAARFFASNNLAVRADAFRRLGGFDPSYGLAGGEDRDLCDRFVRAGSRLAYRSDAVVAHAHAMTLTGFWRQHDWYGRGAYRFHRARADRNQEPVRVEPLRFYRDLLASPFTQHRGGKAFALAGLLALSQVANAAGFFSERRQIGRRAST